ncbi:hypothetical protein F3Y22_tig00112738pilonHSYRG01021 [Hibiscus syriacus]|uniref:Uncharacterized protein n=1 Tax=Hibiscus syriacus TaxID=106335 RepID=A0A6A2Y407_HIBSY|nr:hypothetical protein F3Y22_tig00112738pilonHSYRG01021 [Hibiscus syriacus]
MKTASFMRVTRLLHDEDCWSVDDTFAMTISRSIGHNILLRVIEIVGDSFVVKLSFELDILRCEVEIQSRVVLLHQIGFELDILRCEVEIQSSVVFLHQIGFELDILRCEVEIQSCVVSSIRSNKLFSL